LNRTTPACSIHGSEIWCSDYQFGKGGGKKILADTQVPINAGKTASGKLTFLSVPILMHNISYMVK
jgi:hypothetical protein